MKLDLCSSWGLGAAKLSVALRGILTLKCSARIGESGQSDELERLDAPDVSTGVARFIAYGNLGQRFAEIESR